MKAYFETSDGNTIVIADPTPEQAAVIGLMGATGIRRIDDDTIDEFVRRADLHDTYVGGIALRELSTGEPVVMTRKILLEALGDNEAIWSNAGLITPEGFDQMIRTAKAVRRNGEGR